MPCCSLVQHWVDAGTLAATLHLSINRGCLRQLPVRQAYSLATSMLIFTDGLPTLALALRRQWDEAPEQRAAWPKAVSILANFACMGLDGVIDMVLSGQDEPDNGAAAAAKLARLLHGTTARPQLLVAALNALAQVVEPDEARRWAASATKSGGLEIAMRACRCRKHAAPVGCCMRQPDQHTGCACTGLPGSPSRQLAARSCCSPALCSAAIGL